MNFICLKVTQQIINHFCFRNKISRTDQCLPTEIIHLVKMRQQVLDIKNTFDIITWLGIYRNTWICIIYNTLQHLGIRSIDFQIHHIKTRCHHLLGSLSTKTDNSLQNVALLRYFILIGQLQRLRQFVDWNIIVLLRHTFIN